LKVWFNKNGIIRLQAGICRGHLNYGQPLIMVEARLSLKLCQAWRVITAGLIYP
jgi:hypothetical protein